VVRNYEVDALWDLVSNRGWRSADWYDERQLRGALQRCKKRIGVQFEVTAGRSMVWRLDLVCDGAKSEAGRPINISQSRSQTPSERY
jgi:hypothetical protein